MCKFFIIENKLNFKDYGKFTILFCKNQENKLNFKYYGKFTILFCKNQVAQTIKCIKFTIKIK